MMIQPPDRADHGATARAKTASGQSVVCITDGRGGALALDPGNPDLRWLARGLRLALDGGLPTSRGALKVAAGQTVYWLSWIQRETEEPSIRVASLYDPSQAVELPRDLIALVIGLIDHLFEHLTPDGRHGVVTE